jgi:hypothetical protein
LKAKHGLKLEQLKYAAYLLVTYAIEVRADELYPVYQEVLRAYKSPVSVRNIIAEEQNHLEEMEKQLKAFSSEWEEMCRVVREIESKLYDVWIKSLTSEISLS